MNFLTDIIGGIISAKYVKIIVSIITIIWVVLRLGRIGIIGLFMLVICTKPIGELIEHNTRYVHTGFYIKKVGSSIRKYSIGLLEEILSDGGKKKEKKEESKVKPTQIGSKTKKVKRRKKRKR